ncbi:hypothetical protein KP78_27520 [Jeotgalibacillus soli]|uniref:Uncharacterized protein n=1 Tax=Jeotgalibacillus soli TaxID=889306 RepID=A0A0C2VMH7_9BACL|nr:hypothetical protein KP78_27520 [Jeotgalibacillus soli]
MAKLFLFYSISELFHFIENGTFINFHPRISRMLSLKTAKI